MNTAIVLRGPGGGGKTAVSIELCRRVKNTAHVPVDKLKKNNPSIPEDWCQRANNAATQLLERNNNVVIDEVFGKRSHFDIAVNDLRDMATIFVVEICFSLEEHIRRNKTKPDDERDRNDKDVEDLYNYYLAHRNSIHNDLPISDPNLSVEQIAQKIIAKSGLKQ